MTYTEEIPSRWTLTDMDGRLLGSPEMTTVAAMISPSPALDAGSVSALRSTWQRYVRDRLDRLARLTPGWDGGHARSVAPSVLDTVLKLASSLVVERTEPKPELVPTPEGGIQLEWHTGDLDLIIECSPCDTVTYYLFDGQTGAESEGPLIDSRVALGEAFRRLGHRP